MPSLAIENMNIDEYVLQISMYGFNGGDYFGTAFYGDWQAEMVCDWRHLNHYADSRRSDNQARMK